MKDTFISILTHLKHGDMDIMNVFIDFSSGFHTIIISRLVTLLSDLSSSIFLSVIGFQTFFTLSWALVFHRGVYSEKLKKP